VHDYNNDQQRLIGFQNTEEVGAVFNPLRAELIKNRRSNLTQFPSDLNREKIDERIFTSPDETKGKGITYLSFPPVPVNYGGLYFPVKNTTQSSSARQGASDEEENINRVEEKTDKSAEKIDRFVSAKLFDDLVDLCKQNRCNNYETYNELMWKTLFTKHENKNLGIGKIYIASPDNLAVYPQGTINPFKFEDRPWWKAANGDESERDVYSFSSSSNDPVKESGVTKVYPDIVSEHNITDLTRTVWFKFNVYNKDYIFAVDVRLNPTSFNLWDKIWYAIILLPLLLLTLPVLIFWVIRHKYVITSSPPLVYKLQRIDRQKASYRANQKSEYKLAITQSVRKTEENIARIKSSNVLSVDSKLLEAKLEKVEESIEGTAQTELIEIKVEKTIDLSLRSGNMKTFELWKLSHPNNEKYVLGLIEVLWQNNRSENEITFDKYFLDSNTSASFELITKELKKHLHTTENDTFLFDQSSQSDTKPDIVGILKDKLAYVKDFANKSESFNNRVLLFDDNAQILKQLYSGASKIFATCSIEFLDYLKNENRLEDVLGLHLEVRYMKIRNSFFLSRT
jgi:hypothetical protein